MQNARRSSDLRAFLFKFSVKYDVLWRKKTVCHRRNNHIKYSHLSFVEKHIIFIVLISTILASHIVYLVS